MKVVYYARVSTEEEKQLNALKNQINILEDFINNQEDWQLVGKYIDEGVTGTETKKRFYYNRMFDDLSTDKFDIIVVKDQSRLMRNILDWYLFIDKLVRSGKRLFFFSEKEFYKPEDQLVTGIKALVAAEYSRELSQKVKDGHKKKQENGVVFGNDRIWGYNYKDGKLTINEDEASIIRLIFDLYVNNYGFRTIYKILEQKGYQNRNGEPFAITTLKRIVRNEKYKGVLVSNKKNKDFFTKKINDVPNEKQIIHTDIVPAIVSKEIWDKANEILSTKKRKNPNASKEDMAGYFRGNHLYSSKIFCGECGSPYWHSISCKKSFWMCKEYKSFGLKKEGSTHGCFGTKFRTETLDSIMKDIVSEFWQNKEDNINKVINILNKVLEDNVYYESIKNLEKDKIRYNRRLENYIDMRADGELSKDQFITKKTEVEEQLSRIEEEIKELKDKNESIATKKQRLVEIQSLLEKKVINSNELSEDIISHFLNKIVVKSANELLMYLNGGFEYLININTDTQNYQYVSVTGQN